MRLEQIIAELEAPIKEIRAYNEELRRSGNKYSRSLWSGLEYPEDDSISGSTFFVSYQRSKEDLNASLSQFHPKEDLYTLMFFVI